MTDALPQAVMAQLEDPFAQLTGNLAGTRRLRFEVVSSTQISPHFQRIVLTAPELDGFSYAPGQDVMLLVAADGSRPVRRRYTIRYLDNSRRLLTLDVVDPGGAAGRPDRGHRPARQDHHVAGGGLAPVHG
jgi:NADPH-dependent ferric siderophore reductase